VANASITAMLRRKTNPIFLWVIAMSLSLSSCSFPILSPENKFLSERIDAEYFSSLPLCEQVRLYAQIGSEYLDLGHDVVVVPKWVTDSIAEFPEGEILNCIVDEGYGQLALLKRNPEKKEEISYVVVALILKLIQQMVKILSLIQYVLKVFMINILLY
jgi:hypothetical protein